MKIHPDDFRVPEDKKVHLRKWPTKVARVYKSKDQYQQMLRDHVGRLDALQQLLYACNQYAVLVIFQAMDAAGKDGVIRHVMSGINPQGCQVFSAKHPSASEVGSMIFSGTPTRDLPERGKIGIFNRSYYEEVLVARRSSGNPARREPCRRRRAASTCGKSASVPSPGWSATCMPTAPASSNSSCICPRRNSAKRFLARIDRSRKRTGSSPPADIEARQVLGRLYARL